MKSLRLFLSIAVLVLLGSGYIASQYHALNGTPVDWTLWVENPAIVSVSLLVLLGAIALAFLKEKT